MKLNWDHILKIWGFWLFAFFSSCSSYLILRVIYPKRFLYELGGNTTYYDISNYLVSDMTFIGIALMLAHASPWMKLADVWELNILRRTFVVGVRCATVVCFGLCIIEYVSLHYQVNILPRSVELLRNLTPEQLQNFRTHHVTDVLETKRAIFWSVIGVCIGTLLGSVSAEPWFTRERTS